MKRIVLLGSNGQLGRDLQNCLSRGSEVVAFTRDDFDVVDHSAAARVITEARADVVINTTAYHRVDDCETEAQLAYSVNVLAVLNLARIANRCNALLVHFSTDYVFDGESSTPYVEGDPPMPLSIYGNSKLAGEFIVRSVARRHLLIRTCGLYGAAGSRGKGGNFVETMLTRARAGAPVRVVADQIVTPTYTADLAEQVSLLVEAGEAGLFHATCEGQCSWYEFAAAIFELSGTPAQLAPTTSEMYPTAATRPRFSVLENARLKAGGMNRMRHWREALAAYLEETKSRRG